MRFIDSVKTGPAKVSNGLDYFVPELPVLGLVFIALRRIFGLRRQRLRPAVVLHADLARGEVREEPVVAEQVILRALAVELEQFH